MTLDQLLKLRHPRNGKPRQTKLYLSQEAFDLLHGTSQLTGLDMSAIVDTLLRETLPAAAPGDKVAARSPYETAHAGGSTRMPVDARRKQETGDIDLD